VKLTLLKYILIRLVGMLRGIRWHAEAYGDYEDSASINTDDLEY
jgi:hypothetical protein